MDVLVEQGPGASPFPDDLKARLRAAVETRGEPPRTRHLRPDGGPRFTNRLAMEASPYLLQHAHNPVDWRPWGDEAFAEAKANDKPVFLSVGYSTCHWCHVMEEESFEDLEIAELLNRLYVPIKVDREERPDVDSIYMQAVQLLTQHGGWPMSVFLAPDRKPFYGGTYFPPRDGVRGARVGFATLLQELHRVYSQERDRAVEAGEQIAQAIRSNLSAAAPTSLPGVHVLNGAAESYGELFDPKEGGVQRAPKFPSSLNTRFLLRYWKRTGAEESLHMATFSLTRMALGGIYDQVGGGFHRYSTDARWLVPHFEKMLYDNALLVPAYVEAWQATGDAFFRAVAEDVLEYVAREMTDPGGAFWSATDADSEGEEGRFFVWTVAQLRDALGPEDGDRAARIFDATEQGNFEGSNVLSLSRVPDAEERVFLDRIRPVLREVRARRPPPLTDRKILTAWNGLMISAFARAGLAFARKDLVDRAARAADHLLSAHRPGGKLARSSMAEKARHAGLLEDHAFLAAALVDLFEASGEARYLREVLPDSYRPRGADRPREARVRRRGADRQFGGGTHLAQARRDHRRGVVSRGGRAALPLVRDHPRRRAAGAGRDAARRRFRARGNPRGGADPASLRLRRFPARTDSAQVLALAGPGKGCGGRCRPRPRDAARA